ncbi:MAG: nucleotide exchange factor GrpE [Bacillota bacterium]|nr:nucleotide exchange factor GrpE [Bacillota bacterium]
MRKRKEQNMTADQPQTDGQQAAAQAEETAARTEETAARAEEAAARAETEEDVEPEAAPEDKTCELEKQLEEQGRQLAQMKDSYLRLMAEYENFRKRSRSEKEALYEQSVADVVTLWLPVLDNLGRARSACETVGGTDVESVVSGLALVERQIGEVLGRLGVEPIAALGETFDPERHEAVLHVEDEEAGPGEVVEVLQEGYRRGERIIRFATVKVAN